MRRVVLALLMLATVLPSAAFARTEYRCTMDGKVRTACCCPAPAARQVKREPRRGSSIRKACCCDISTIEPADKPSANLTPAAGAVSPPSLVAIAIAVAAVVPDVVVTRVVHRANAPPCPSPLFARHCALLL